jgi:hypothetical protein
MTSNGRPMTRTGERPITRADLESKFEQLRSSVGSGADVAKGGMGMGAAVGAGIVLLLVVYLLGRRRGRKRQTIVEIRRV